MRHNLLLLTFDFPFAGRGVRGRPSAEGRGDVAPELTELPLRWPTGENVSEGSVKVYEGSWRALPRTARLAGEGSSESPICGIDCPGGRVS